METIAGRGPSAVNLLANLNYVESMWNFGGDAYGAGVGSEPNDVGGYSGGSPCGYDAGSAGGAGSGRDRGRGYGGHCGDIEDDWRGDDDGRRHGGRRGRYDDDLHRSYDDREFFDDYRYVEDRSDDRRERYDDYYGPRAPRVYYGSLADAPAPLPRDVLEATVLRTHAHVSYAAIACDAVNSLPTPVHTAEIATLVHTAAAGAWASAAVSDAGPAVDSGEAADAAADAAAAGKARYVSTLPVPSKRTYTT